MHSLITRLLNTSLLLVTMLNLAHAYIVAENVTGGDYEGQGPWDVDYLFFQVGWDQDEPGKLTIADKSEVFIRWGLDVGGKGVHEDTVLVRGRDSFLSIGSDYIPNEPSVQVGYYGVGSVVVSDGATVACSSTSIGRFLDGFGTVAVTGPDSYWSSQGAFTIGGSGTATLSIANGGRVFSYSGLIATASHTTADAVISGSDSIWECSGIINVSENGCLTITDGGEIYADGLKVNDGGSLSLDGGTVRFRTYSSTGSIDYRAGLVQLAGFRAIGQDPAIKDFFGISPTISHGKSLAIEGDATIRTNLRIDGGSLSGDDILSIYGSGSSEVSLAIENGGHISSQIAYLADAPGSRASAEVMGIGSLWNSDERLYVGSYGSGSLNISAGANVSNAVGSIGQWEGSSGAVVVGANSAWVSHTTLQVGYRGEGNLTIDNGGAVYSNSGFIGANFGSIGTVLVTGSNSVWNSNFLNVGDAGEASLTIANGAAVFCPSNRVGNASSNEAVRVMVTESGLWQGSSLSIASGEVLVTDGGKIVSTSSVNIAGHSSKVRLTGTGSSLTSRALNVHGGELLVDDDATAFISDVVPSSSPSQGGSLYVGHSGDGEMVIGGGAKVSAATGAYIGTVVGGNGSIAISDVGSRLTANQRLSIGDVSSGELLIQNGAIVTSGSGVVGAGGDGRVRVAGAGAKWTSSSIYLAIRGDASLDIVDGGQVVSNVGIIGAEYELRRNASVEISGTGSSWRSDSIAVEDGTLTVTAGGTVFSQFGTVGHWYDQNQSGSVSIVGEGASWRNSGRLNVYNGDLTIADGGEVSSESAYVDASKFNTAAVINVTNSIWQVSGDLAVGAGQMTIADGGRVVGNRASIRGRENNSGTVSLTGPGSALAMNDRLSIGRGLDELDAQEGPGILSIGGGGLVTASQVAVGTLGQLKLEGGALQTSRVNFDVGGEFIWQSGALQIDWFGGDLANPAGRLIRRYESGQTAILGDYTQGSGAALEIELGPVYAPGWMGYLAPIVIEGSAVLGGELKISLAEGYTPNSNAIFHAIEALQGLFGGFSNVAFGDRLATVDGRGSFLVDTSAVGGVYLTDFQSEVDGDFNGDMTVDGSDFLAWQRDLGGASLESDGDGNGIVDGDDLMIWRNHFGRGGASGLIAIPEPSAMFLFAFAGICLSRNRRNLVSRVNFTIATELQAT